MNLIWLNQTKPGRMRVYCLYEKTDAGYEKRGMVAWDAKAGHRRGWNSGVALSMYEAGAPVGEWFILKRLDDACAAVEARVRRGRRKA